MLCSVQVVITAAVHVGSSTESAGPADNASLLQLSTLRLMVQQHTCCLTAGALAKHVMHTTLRGCVTAILPCLAKPASSRICAHSAALISLINPLVQVAMPQDKGC